MEGHWAVRYLGGREHREEGPVSGQVGSRGGRGVGERGSSSRNPSVSQL